MISGPAVGGDDAGRHFVYDAWNRLRKVYADDGDGQFEPSDGQGTGEDALIAAYQYDGAKRRIEKAVTEGADTHYYYNHDWQVVEQRESPLPLGEGQGEGGTALAVSYLYLWSPRYIDAPVLRDRYDAEGELDESARVYYLGDTNHNVTALVGLVETAPSVFAWQVAERYLYDPYGRATVCDADWTIRPDGPDANPTPGDESAFGNAVLYCGYHLDAETGLYHVRHRYYHATLSTWMSRDPLESDPNLYRYCANNPVLYTDPSGNDWLDCMSECIQDNDPLPYALGAAAKAILATGGWQSKTALAQIAKMLGDEKLAEGILKSLRNPGVKPVSNIPSFIVAAKRAGGTKAGQAFRMLGGKAAAILGPIQIAYGLALAAIETHCAGWCCTAWWYGIPYNHADGNVIDAWKNTYFDL